jgi:hypothetical protein
MKYIKKLTWLLVLGAGLMTASCSDNDDVEIPGGLAIDKEQIEIGAEGGSEQLAIAASQNWVSSVVEPWLMLTPANGVGSTTWMTQAVTRVSMPQPYRLPTTSSASSLQS